MKLENTANSKPVSPIRESFFTSSIKNTAGALAFMLTPLTALQAQQQDTIISTTIVCDCDDNKTTRLDNINSSKVKHKLVGFSLIYKGELNLYDANNNYTQKPCQEIRKLFYSLPIKKKKKKKFKKESKLQKPKEFALSLHNDSEDIAYQE